MDKQNEDFKLCIAFKYVYLNAKGRVCASSLAPLNQKTNHHVKVENLLTVLRNNFTPRMKYDLIHLNTCFTRFYL